jgi:cytochrome b561
MTTDVKNYNLTARLIHWFSALIIIAMFGLGLWMVELTYYSQWYEKAPHWHKSIGIMLLLLTLFRLFWKLVTVSPLTQGSAFEKIAAKAVHHAIYLNLLVIFISGYLISTADGRGIDVFDWFTIPGAGALFADQSDTAGNIHLIAAWTLISMAVLHILAALKHHFINKDNTLRKMIGASK